MGQSAPPKRGERRDFSFMLATMRTNVHIHLSNCKDKKQDPFDPYGTIKYLVPCLICSSHKYQTTQTRTHLSSSGLFHRLKLQALPEKTICIQPQSNMVHDFRPRNVYGPLEVFVITSHIVANFKPQWTNLTACNKHFKPSLPNRSIIPINFVVYIKVDMS